MSEIAHARRIVFGVRPPGLLVLLMTLFAAGPGPSAPLQMPMPAPETKPPEAKLTLKGHAKGVFNVAFSPDGKRLATAGKDRNAVLWDADSGAQLRVCRGHAGSVYSCAFSPDGRLLATASEDRAVKIWDVTSGKELRGCVGHGGDVYQVVFSPDGKCLASASADQTVRLWDPENGKLLHELKGHTHRVCTASFSPDGGRLVSACGTSNANDATAAGGEIKVWDVATGQELMSLPRVAGVITVAFGPDGKRLACACMGKKVKILEAATGQEALVLEGHTLDVYHVVFSPDGRWLASCCARWNKEEPGEIKVWDLATGRELLSFRGHAMTTWSLAFSPDGKRLASCCGKWSKDDPGEAKVWDLAAAVKELKPMPREPEAKELRALWDDLRGADAPRAYRAVWALSATPAQTVPFLREHAAAPPRDPAVDRIPQLVAELDSDDFQTRERASEALAKLGRRAAPALQKALASSSAEVRRRAAALLEKKSDPPPLTPDELRALRTVEVLQHVGAPDALPVLRKLAKEAAGTPLGQDAAAALAQLSAGRRN